ncbi:MAG: oligosaccharide flippase family protein [Alphaproteobacteria bacterium]|nr:oligosaccharide flippase family protein [Alphaproteobacteria bacterium SS10]
MLVPQRLRDKLGGRFRGGGVLVTGRLGIALAKFGRNIILARLIGAEQFGIASTFIIALSFVELLSDLGLEKLVVQDRRGEDPRFIGAIQGLALLRAALISVLLLVLAGPAAALFNQPDLVWAYQLFAILPLLRGVLHLDVYRQERSLRYQANILPESIGVIVSLLALWPLSLWLGDFRIVLVIFAIEIAIYAIGTHLTAERRFNIGWDTSILKHSLRFGLPLIASGFLTFLALQGDRVIVANQFNAVELGLFSAALVLGMTPFLVLIRISNSLLLPLFSELRDDPAAMAGRIWKAIACLAAMALAASIGAWLLGSPIYQLVYGKDFATGAALLLPVVLIFACRFARSAMTTASLALGRTQDIMWANMTRVIALPVAFYWITQKGGSIEDLLMIALVGEVAAYILAMALLTMRLRQR